MTTQSLIPWLVPQFFASSGAFLTGGQLWTYQAGTQIAAATFTDSTGLNQNTNPVIANSRGEMSVWIPVNTAYKFVLMDAAGNTIWTRDQVINSSLVTYYGVDSGFANNYIVTAATPYTSYQNGQLVFFVPANTNTGPSTININGLGPIPIVTITGIPVTAGQITAGIMTELIYFNGSFQLLSIGNTFGSSVGTFGAEIPIASAATTDLGTTPNHNVAITGTTTITSFGSNAVTIAPIYIARFTGSLTLTNSSSLSLPGSANIITQPGDSLLAEYFGAGVWKVLAYFPATGSNSNSKIKPGDTTRSSSAVLIADPDLYSNQLGVGRYSWEAFLIFDSVAAGAGFQWTNGGSAIDSRGLAPATAYGFVNSAPYGPKSETPYANTITYATVATGANSNEVLYKGSLLISTPGTFGINWAQAVSTGSATTLRAGSYLTLNILNTGTAAGIVTRINTTPGTFVETFPSGYNTLTVEVWGGSAGGGIRFVSGIDGAGGGGGGASGYSRTTYTVTGLGGDTLNFTVGAAGTVAGAGGGVSSVSAGTAPAFTTMTANGGGTGGDASGLFAPGIAGVGGTATGGTVINTTGANGTAGSPSAGGGSGAGGQGGVGGFGTPGIFDGGNVGGHGAGLNQFTSGTAGGTGIVVFSYSP